MTIQNPRPIRPFHLFAGTLIAVLAMACSAHAQNLGKTGTDGVTVVAPQAKIQPTSSLGAGKATASGEGGRSTQEGVKVHGHWIIDVKNPDGSLAEHRDFENSLSNANIMVELLYGILVPADFAVLLYGSTPPCSTSNSSYPCVIAHNLSTLPANAICGTYYCVTGLTVTPTLGGSPSLVLAGNLTATQAGNINTVATYIGTCGSSNPTPTTVSPSTCAAGNNGYGYSGLTQTSITSVPVVSGQIIQVTVTITFS
jgi:hypothetical protein